VTVSGTLSDCKRLSNRKDLLLVEESSTRPNQQLNQAKNPRSSAHQSPHRKPTKTDKSAITKNKQTDQPQTQKPQVLPKVFSNTSRSNLAQPQTPVTSAASLSAQNAAKTGSDRLRAPDSVASAQRQLYPLANSDVVKRLIS